MKRHKNKRNKKGARLGQHFLIHAAVAEAVADAAEVSTGDRVLEIGPGTGILTKVLLARGARVVAVEKDPAMVSALKETFVREMREKKLTILEGDVRTLTPDKIFPKGKYKVAANIPYYITGELLRTCLTTKNQPRVIAFLVQKEVANRIARSSPDVKQSGPRPGRRGKESILSLSVKAYGTPRYVKSVSRGNFAPQPNVDSAILAVTSISRENFENVSEEKLFKIVKTGFAQKRKTLAGNLRRAFGEGALGVLAACGIPENTRAEDVPLEKWLVLAKKL